MPEYRDPPVAAARPFGLFSVEPPTSRSDGPWSTGGEWEPEANAISLNYANALCALVGTNEVQTITITGAPTGGFFTLTYMGQTTANIPRNATNAQVQSALALLPNFQTGDVVITGGPGPATPYIATFGGRYAATDMPQMTAAHTFTGGTTPAIAVTTTTPGVRTAKTVTAPAGSVSSDAFSVYVLRQCRTVADFDRAKTRAMNMLSLNEEAAVEKEVWTRIIAATPTNITPATPPTPEIGLAMLEEAIGANYAGRPIIHASLDLASILTTRRAAERHGTHLETGLGSMFVAGRGYPRTGPGGAPAAGTEWLMATGGMFIDRGNANVRGPFLIQSPLDNTQSVLAERTYLTGMDSTPVAIRVTFP